MSIRWTITPAALGVAATVGFVGVTGVAGINRVDPVSVQPTATAVDADWGMGWGVSPSDVGTGGWAVPDFGTDTDATTTAAQALSSSAASAVAEVTPAVVNIDTVLDYGTAEAAGTGIVIGSDGLVLTNHHVVEGATTITGTVVGTGRTYTATVLGYDPDTDVALIDLAGVSGLPVATLGDSDDLAVGDLVVGVGNAGGVGGDPTSVEGQVTALGQTITATDQNGGNAETLDNLIGTDADIQAGQSGGPLVDAEGDVVGVDVAASSGYTGSTTSGYAIPIEDAKAVAEQILAGQESGTVQIGATPFLGVSLADTSVADPGMDWGFPGGYGSGSRVPRRPGRHLRRRDRAGHVRRRRSRHRRGRRGQRGRPGGSGRRGHHHLPERHGGHLRRPAQLGDRRV